MMRYLSLTFRGLIGALLLSHQVQAHQMKEAITVVNFNQNTSLLEVAHRVYIHDAEVVLKSLFGKDSDLISNPKSQQQFGQYIVEHFAIQLDDKPLHLYHLGHEIKGKYFWVYQEHPFVIAPKQIKLKYDAMMGHWPDQRNVINIEGLGPTKSTELYKSDNTQIIEFDK